MCTDPSPGPSLIASEAPLFRGRKRPGRREIWKGSGESKKFARGSLRFDFDLEGGERRFWMSLVVRAGGGGGVVAKGSKGEGGREVEAEAEDEEVVEELELELVEGAAGLVRRVLGAVDFGTGLVEGAGAGAETGGGAGAGAGAGAAAELLGLLSLRREVARLGSIVWDWWVVARC